MFIILVTCLYQTVTYTTLSKIKIYYKEVKKGFIYKINVKTHVVCLYLRTLSEIEDTYFRVNKSLSFRISLTKHKKGETDIKD